LVSLGGLPSAYADDGGLATYLCLYLPLPLPLPLPTPTSAMAMDPGPGTLQYSPRVLPSGKEWSMAQLNGAELNPSAAFARIQTAESRVPIEYLHKPIPAPHDYQPQLMHNGKEWEMYQMNGAELNKSAAFAPIQTAESRVPIELLHKQTPAPHDYTPLLMPNGKEWEMTQLNGAELNKSAAFAPIQTAESRVPLEILHKQLPAPHDYTPLLMPNGKEWSMHDLNGAELNKSAAFAPIQTAESRVPLERLHPVTPGPDMYRPMMTSSGKRLLMTLPGPTLPELSAERALFATVDPEEAVARSYERLRARKPLPPLLDTVPRRLFEAPPRRSTVAAKWSDRVPDADMNGRRPRLAYAGDNSYSWLPLMGRRSSSTMRSSLSRSRSTPLMLGY